MSDHSEHLASWFSRDLEPHIHIADRYRQSILDMFQYFNNFYGPNSNIQLAVKVNNTRILVMSYDTEYEDKFASVERHITHDELEKLNLIKENPDHLIAWLMSIANNLDDKMQKFIESESTNERLQ